MHDSIYHDRNGHRTWLKWHRARRKASDPVFTGARILEGMRLGASVEVDLVIHKDRGFAVLHDETAQRETSGAGRVADLSAAQLRQLFLRDNDGSLTDQKVMLLEDLAALLEDGGAHPKAVLQLDYKQDAKALDDLAIRTFRQSVAPVAPHMILSSGDAEAVALLTAGVPGLRIGYDPCHGDSLEQLSKSLDFAGFVGNAVAASPNAEMIYLAYPVVLSATKHGFDIVGAFHAADRRIDAYTIKRADETTAPIIATLLDCRVDQITTDDPEGVGALIAGL
jgi:glycerophosphoryl diester phosphodiesterase